MIISLKDELKQEIIEWDLVIRRITNYKITEENSYLDMILNQAETNKEHIQKRINNIVTQKITDLFNSCNAELEDKKQKETLSQEKLYYNAQQINLAEFYQKILKIITNDNF